MIRTWKRKYGIIAISLLILFGSMLSCKGGDSQSATIPKAPLGVTILSGEGILVLGWQKSPGAASYNVYLSSSAGVTKSNYSGLPDGMKLTKAQSPFTISGLTNDKTYHAVITAVNEAGESGISEEVQDLPVLGIGDAGNYMPLIDGNSWTSSVTITANDGTNESFTRTTTINGTRTINGAVAKVYTETESRSPNSVYEEYLLQDSNGVIILGDNDTTDPLTPQMVPYWAIKYPFLTSTSYTQIDKLGLDYGEDLDGDGVREKIDMYAHVNIAAIESVTVPAGTFANCAREYTQISSYLTFSNSGSWILISGSQTVWYAPGIGLVKKIITMESGTYSETETEVLTGYSLQ